MKKICILIATIRLLAAVGLRKKMSDSGKTGITWTKLAIALALLCSMFSFGAIAQTKPEKPLAKAAADALVGELKEGLADLIEDEEAVAAIVKKWEARNLAGRTRTQILSVLFADVKSIVEDKETQDSVWEGWQEVGLEEEEAEEDDDDKPVTPPVVPSKPTTVSPAPQPKGYLPTMTENITKLFAAMGKEPATLKDLAIQFEKIGDAQKTEWLPYYYAAYAQATAGWLKFDLDANADKGKALLDKAEALSKGNSEIYVLRSLIAMQQMLVDPLARYISYGVEANDALGTAKKLNPNNPRVYMMQGEVFTNTPEQFGGGKAKAKPYFEEALRKFDVFKPESSISPNWGRKHDLSLLAPSNQ